MLENPTPTAQAGVNYCGKRYIFEWGRMQRNDMCLHCNWARSPEPEKAQGHRVHNNCQSLCESIDKQYAQPQSAWLACISMRHLNSVERLQYYGNGDPDCTVLLNPIDSIKWKRIRLEWWCGPLDDGNNNHKEVCDK